MKYSSKSRILVLIISSVYLLCFISKYSYGKVINMTNKFSTKGNSTVYDVNSGSNKFIGDVDASGHMSINSSSNGNGSSTNASSSVKKNQNKKRYFGNVDANGHLPINNSLTNSAAGTSSNKSYINSINSKAVKNVIAASNTKSAGKSSVTANNKRNLQLLQNYMLSNSLTSLGAGTNSLDSDNDSSSLDSNSLSDLISSITGSGLNKNIALSTAISKIQNAKKYDNVINVGNGLYLGYKVSTNEYVLFDSKGKIKSTIKK